MSMILLIPARIIADMFFVLLLKLLAVNLEVMAQVVAADGMVIQIFLLKKDRIPLSFAPLS
jgi:hypothetical protein